MIEADTQHQPLASIHTCTSSCTHNKWDLHPLGIRTQTRLELWIWNSMYLLPRPRYLKGKKRQKHKTNGFKPSVPITSPSNYLLDPPTANKDPPYLAIQTFLDSASIPIRGLHGMTLTSGRVGQPTKAHLEYDHSQTSKAILWTSTSHVTHISIEPTQIISNFHRTPVHNRHTDLGLLVLMDPNQWMPRAIYMDIFFMRVLLVW